MVLPCVFTKIWSICRFLELSSALEPGRPPKTDKATILGDAVRILTQLRSEAQGLQETNNQLRETVKDLKVSNLIVKFLYKWISKVWWITKLYIVNGSFSRCLLMCRQINAMMAIWSYQLVRSSFASYHTCGLLERHLSSMWLLTSFQSQLFLRLS